MSWLEGRDVVLQCCLDAGCMMDRKQVDAGTNRPPK